MKPEPSPGNNADSPPDPWAGEPRAVSWGWVYGLLLVAVLVVLYLRYPRPEPHDELDAARKQMLRELEREQRDLLGQSADDGDNDAIREAMRRLAESPDLRAAPSDPPPTPEASAAPAPPEPPTPDPAPAPPPTP